MLTRDQIREAADLVTEKVEVPEWGGAVFVKRMTALEVSEYHDKKKKMPSATVALLIYCAVDESGNNVFTPDDAEWLAQKSCKAVDRIAGKAIDLNFDREEKGESEAVKNSEQTQQDGAC